MAKTTKAADDEVLRRCRDRFAYVSEVDADNRKRAAEDTAFVYEPGGDWSDADKKKRKAADDPVMSFPQLGQFVAQVVNDQRQNRPGIRIHPVDGDASEDVAEILQGLIRGIEYDSRAESVYDCGYQASVVGGRGYWRITSEYESPKSFNQKLKIARIADAQSVYLDPDYQEPDGGDRQYGFVVDTLHEDEFKRKYPKAKKLDFDAGDEAWFPKEKHVIVADYYERVSEKRTLVTLGDGTTAYRDEMPEGAMVALDEQGEPIEREVDVYRVDWYTVAGGQQILDTHEWPGTIIPVVCTMGNEVVIDGQRVFQGLITPAKDTQRMFNFGMAQQAVTLLLAPRTPWIAPAEAIEGYEAMWKTSNTTNYSHLPYHAFTESGEPIPAPQRTPGATVDQGWLNWTQQMMGLMRSTIGMYESSLGMRANETSGRAIIAKEKQSDTATFHFQDNLARAIALTGRILVECIPTYYDTERIVHIVGPDDQPKRETINAEAVDPMAPYQAIKMNDISVGQYAVTVQAGPGYATKKQEMAELMMQLVQAYPPLMQFAGDIVVRVQDIPEADELSKRLKLTLPPPIQQAIAAEEQGQTPPDPQMMQQMQQMQMQMQQAQQMMQQLQQENMQLKQGADAKVQAAQMDAEAKLQAAQASGATDVQIAQMKAESDAQIAIIKAKIEAETKLAIAQISQPLPGEDAQASGETEDDGQEQMALIALAQAVDNLARAAAAPRRMQLHTDENGNPVGGSSMPMMQ